MRKSRPKKKHSNTHVSIEIIQMNLHHMKNGSAILAKTLAEIHCNKVNPETLVGGLCYKSARSYKRGEGNVPFRTPRRWSSNSQIEHSYGRGEGIWGLWYGQFPCPATVENHHSLWRLKNSYTKWGRIFWTYSSALAISPTM